MPTDFTTGVFFDAVYPDATRARRATPWILPTTHGFPESLGKDDGRWGATRWGSSHWAAGIPFDPTDVRFLGVFPDTTTSRQDNAKRQRFYALLASGHIHQIAEFTDPLKPLQNVDQFPPIYPDRFWMKVAAPQYYPNFFWYPITPAIQWVEPATASITSTWTQPAVAASSTTWTEPAITPTPQV